MGEQQGEGPVPEGKGSSTESLPQPEPWQLKAWSHQYHPDPEWPNMGVSCSKVAPLSEETNEAALGMKRPSFNTQ